jgi:signal transduction histidine kinase/DNA-binding response OmpR family regulator
MNRESKFAVAAVPVMAALVALTFFVDLLTPLGAAPWTLYLLAIGASLLHSNPMAPIAVAAASSVLSGVGLFLSPSGMDPGMAALNRGFGAIAMWAMAGAMQHVIRARNRVDDLLWLQRARTRVAQSLLGDQAADDVGRNAMSTLARLLHADIGVLYRLDGDVLVRSGGHAIDPQQVPERIVVPEGLPGQVAADGVARSIDPVPAGHLPIRTAFGQSRPVRLVIAPIVADGQVAGVAELGAAGSAMSSERALALMEAVAESVGVALRTAHYRERLISLLEETQRQSEELQTQQEELRVANEELEQQTRVLEQSQSQLEMQQSDLEQTNLRLEEQTQMLERQKKALVEAQQALLANAEHLESANRYKSEFLANMSHELRTPLNSALILSRLLADNKEGTLTAEQVKYAKAIHASNNDLLALINDVLDLSKIEAGHVELDVETVELPVLLARLRATFEPLAQQKGLELRIEPDTDAPESLLTDSLRLAQILKNLMANAVKFTERGHILLRVLRSEEKHVLFEVRDTGVGIPRDKLEVIFEAFRQADGSTSRRFGGTGLGLSISRELARRLGGDIRADSEPGRGSVFTLRLPIEWSESEAPAKSQMAGTGPAGSAHSSIPAPAGGAAASGRTGVPAREDAHRSEHAGAQAGAATLRAGKGGHWSNTPSATPAVSQTPAISRSTLAGLSASELPPDDRAAPKHPGRMILAVEDDLNFARLLVDLAHEQEFDCVIAPTAAEALRLAHELQPNGILLDVGLPDASGLSVLERLKNDPATRHIPVHMVSLHDRTQTALELGAVGYLCKPADREQLVEVFQRIEERIRRTVRRLLIVEDDAQLRENLELLLGGEQVQIVSVGRIGDALRELEAATFDCMVMDLILPDGTGYDLLERIARGDQYAFPPVIVYTGRALRPEDEERLRRYSKSIIVKGARSPERLLDEVTLFLHSVESSLPAKQQKLLRQARQRDAVLEGRKILLAEDDVRNIFALSSVFEPLGAKLEVARNGREALQRLEEHQEIDLVLMDIMMPEMDGLTAMRKIRERSEWARLPVIALTAKAMSDDRERCLAAGANDYIAKPIDVDKLVSLCRVWMPK